MDRQAIITKIAEVLGDVVGDDNLVLTEATTAEDVEDWDSINHVKLLIGLEEDLDIHFETSETGSLANVGELVALLERKLAR